MTNLKKLSKNIYSLPFDMKLNLNPEPAPKHRGPMINALDFAMQNGTPIYTAKSGKVIEVIDKFRKGGASELLRKSANLVRIQHKGDEYSEYAHLKYKSIKVKQEAMVYEGDLIGYSGETGFTTYPHLHFMVYEFIEQKPGWRSLIVRFRINNKIHAFKSPKK